MNTVSITGRLTRTVEVRSTNTGKQVLNFTLAVDDFGGGKKYTSFIDVVAFDRPNLVPYLLQGQLVGVSGRLRQNRWESDGQKRSKVEVVAQNIELLGKAKKDEETPQQASQPVQPMTGIVTEPVQAHLYDEDIPF